MTRRVLRVAVAVLAATAVATDAAPAGQGEESLPGLVRAGAYAPAGAASSSEGAPAQGSVYAVAAFPLLEPGLPPGEGRDLVMSYCSVCHSVRYIPMQPRLPAGTWQAIVNKMVQIHGAPIPEEAASRIMAYLQAHFATQ